MKQLFRIMAFAVLALLAHGPALASSDKGSADDAVALVRKASAYLKAHGKEKAYAAFSDAAGQFKDRDLYIFVIDFNGKLHAHGANPKLIDKNLVDLKDADNKPFIKELIDVAKSKGKGWVDYKWPHPVTKAIESKSSYVEKVDDVFIGCGIYK
ncbi:MAG: cache domain-containing protein [Noviherbaspirillum sp.]